MPAVAAHIDFRWISFQAGLLSSLALTFPSAKISVLTLPVARYLGPALVFRQLAETKTNHQRCSLITERYAPPDQCLVFAQIAA